MLLLCKAAIDLSGWAISPALFCLCYRIAAVLLVLFKSCKLNASKNLNTSLTMCLEALFPWCLHLLQLLPLFLPPSSEFPDPWGEGLIRDIHFPSGLSVPKSFTLHIVWPWDSVFVLICWRRWLLWGWPSTPLLIYEEVEYHWE